MKVRIVVTVDVDPQTWSEEYGCDTSEVREDVHRYFDTHIGCAPAVEDAALTVVAR